MDREIAARLRRAHKIRIWTGAVVIVVGLAFAFGNPWIFGRENTTFEILVGLVMAAFGVLNVVLSVVGLRKLRNG